MKRRKLLDISRRKFVQASAGAVAAGALLGKRAFAAPRPLKIGYVSPETGALATFGEADAFVIPEIRKILQGGIQSGGVTRPVEILVRDGQSSPNRAAEVAAELIKTDKVDLMLVGRHPGCRQSGSRSMRNQPGALRQHRRTLAAYFFGRGGNTRQRFRLDVSLLLGRGDHSGCHSATMFDQVPTNKVVGCLWANDVDGIVFSDPENGCPPIFRSAGL